MSNNTDNIYYNFCCGTDFNIRSKNYLEDNVKIKSKKSIYKLLSIKKIMNIDIKKYNNIKSNFIYYTKLPKNINIKILVPEKSTLFGKNKFYALCFKNILNIDKNSFLEEYVEVLLNYINLYHDPNNKNFFKIITKFCNINELKLNSFIKPFVEIYNGKPCLLRNTVKIININEDNIDIIINANKWKFLSKKILFQLINIKNINFKLAFLIEGINSNELPERILTSFQTNTNYF